MNSIQLVLGNQLFHPFDHLDPTIDVIMIEHRDLCQNYRYHKQKIAFFFAAMRHYKQALEDQGFTVIYHPYNPHETRSFCQVVLESKKSITSCHIIEVVDHDFRDTLHEELQSQGVSIIPLKSPMFLRSEAEFSDYIKSVKRPFMKVYYERVRKSANILMENGQPLGGKYSFDELNRKKCPKTLVVPTRKIPPISTITQAVIAEVNTYFLDHVGDACDMWLPVTRADAKAWWRHFLVNYFELFGDYEDAIDNRDDFLFHSAISPLLNIGLITPAEVIEDALLLTDKIPLNSLEGFIRQVIGWREFIRGIYSEYHHQQETSNFFNHKRRLRSHWWDGTTGHLPLDDAIKTTVKRAYTHHINRLMVIGATMLTTEILPKEAHDWFMVMYADSSDWVMGPNVYGMSLFSDGGIFATKPYLCGSNYIRKMSHYGEGEWCDIADGLYWRFISKHTAFFAKNARMGLAVKSLEKMAADKKTRLFKAADAFIAKVTE